MTIADDIAYCRQPACSTPIASEAVAGRGRRKACWRGSTRCSRKINAFCVVDRDGALAAARDAEARWAKGEPQGPLDGVPVTIKDLVLMRGFPTRAARG